MTSLRARVRNSDSSEQEMSKGVTSAPLRYLAKTNSIGLRRIGDNDCNIERNGVYAYIASSSADQRATQ